MTFGSNQFVAVAVLVCLAGVQHAPSCCAQGGADSGIEIATIDAKTRWAFRALSPVTVTSPIVRLGDVVKPLDPNMAGWQRLRRSPIGLVPVDGQSMTIQRDRLAKAIHDAEATPRAIDWLGPAQIKVLYRQSSSTGKVIPATYQDPRSSPSADASPNQTAGLSSAQAQRIIHWIDLAIERQTPSVAETYRIAIDSGQAGLVALKSISGVTTIEPLETIGEGKRRFHVVARSIDGQVESDIEVMLEAHPTIVVPRKTFPRGHRIEPGDLTIASIPEDEMERDYVTDADSVIGLEVRGAVRANRPIHLGDLSAPILIHRGDLIEVRVVAGGITVTTNAKAIGDGAASDLVEIETFQPRRRLVARVVSPGVAEIVTRAPRVSP